MYRIFLLLVLSIPPTLLLAETFVLRSPDGANRLTIEVDDKLTYEIQRDNKVLLNHSPISVQWDNGIEMNKSQLTIKKVRRNKQKGTVKPVIGPERRMNYAYNEIHILFEEPYDLIFRVYNQGVAYRFGSRLNKKEKEKALLVLSEQSSFNFVGDPLIYYPQVKKFQNSFEENYQPLNRSQIPSNSMALTPAMVETEAGPLLLISEAQLSDYPGMYLVPTSSGLEAVFPPAVKKQSQEFLGKLGFKKAVVSGMKARSREKYLANTRTNRLFPWRVIMLADNAAEMADNRLIYALAPSLKLKKTDWIKPGKVAWDWYHNWKIPNAPFKPGINTETYFYYIDFAAQNGFSYINLDEGWTHNKKLLEVNKDIDIEKIVAYGRQKDVGVFIWMMWWVLDENMEEYLDQFAKWGVAGIKVDFMDRDDQYVVNFYERLAQEAAKRKLLVNLHGAYKPTGLAQAYPNIINREGVVGLENNKFSTRCTPTHNLTIPFIRNVLGPMDYTPGAMRHVSPKKFKKSWKNPAAMSTRAQQLAMYVVYYGPLQMISDAPPYYPAEALDFLAKVPTVWDKSKCLQGKVGESIVMARKHGNEWYVGGMTSENARSINLSLDFLNGGKRYVATIWQDGEELDDLVLRKEKVKKGDSLEIDMASTGGFAIIFSSN